MSIRIILKWMLDQVEHDGMRGMIDQVEHDGEKNIVILRLFFFPPLYKRGLGRVRHPRAVFLPSLA